ncbi:hypothetical protein K435DRAFT_782081 [Dendrothele bispora CBS 962.96]|uniref:Uncharacterized protein n=1 Tax=Dendrothele bispora (strain CBS 962.96) TaxID=1314807 RepID=A0A4S8LH10_DENBC|nr:hypothetical protein K435DRAFT_782081 [Dendrothele bispora CBS 962.96]
MEQLRSHSFTASPQVQDCIMFSQDLLLHGIGCISRASNSPKTIDSFSELCPSRWAYTSDKLYISKPKFRRRSALQYQLVG